jgi:hypothetical protein
MSYTRARLFANPRSPRKGEVRRGYSHRPRTPSPPHRIIFPAPHDIRVPLARRARVSEAPVAHHALREGCRCGPNAVAVAPCHWLADHSLALASRYKMSPRCFALSTAASAVPPTTPFRRAQKPAPRQEVRVPDFFLKKILRAVRSAVLLDLVACCVFVVREMRERCEFPPPFLFFPFFFRVVFCDAARSALSLVLFRGFVRARSARSEAWSARGA